MDVSILMPTYNHEKFISQAVESVLVQKTDFSYELLINDDCSTDGTRKIAQEYADKYPEKIKLIYPEKNQGLLKSYKRLLEIAQGEYIAILESDDFWHADSNLQKKLSFLKNNEEYALIASKTNLVDENSQLLRVSESNYSENGDWYTDLLYQNTIRAVSVIFKRQVFDNYCDIQDYIEKNFLTFDYPVWLSISAHAKCKYLDEILCSYRVLGSSISNNKNYVKLKTFSNSIHEIQKYIMVLYPPKNDFSSTKFRQVTAYNDMLLALKHHNFMDYYKTAKKISTKNGGIKNFVIKYFTVLFYVQHCLRGKK